MLLKRKREKEGKGKTKALCRVPSTEPRKARQGTRSFPLQTLARYAAIPPRPRLRHACCHGDSRAQASHRGGTAFGGIKRGEATWECRREGMEILIFDYCRQ